jgi:hypothetical protein
MLNKLFKPLLALVLCFSVFSLGMVVASQLAYADSIKDRIQKSQGGSGSSTSELEKKVDDSTSNIVKTVRRLAIFLSFLFGIWLGICFLRGGFSPDTLRETKGRMGFFILFLLLAFWTEDILATAFNFLGIDISKL